MPGAFPCRPLEGALHRPGSGLESCQCTAVWPRAGRLNSKNSNGAALGMLHDDSEATGDPFAPQCRHLHVAVGALPLAPDRAVLIPTALHRDLWGWSQDC